MWFRRRRSRERRRRRADEDGGVREPVRQPIAVERGGVSMERRVRLRYVQWRRARNARVGSRVWRVEVRARRSGRGEGRGSTRGASDSRRRHRARKQRQYVRLGAQA